MTNTAPICHCIISARIEVGFPWEVERRLEYARQSELGQVDEVRPCVK